MARTGFQQEPPEFPPTPNGAQFPPDVPMMPTGTIRHRVDFRLTLSPENVFMATLAYFAAASLVLFFAGIIYVFVMRLIFQQH